MQITLEVYMGFFETGAATLLTDATLLVRTSKLWDEYYRDGILQPGAGISLIV